MFETVKEIISHTWESSYAGDQSYIYYICGGLIIVFTVFVLDKLSNIFNF